MPESLKITIPGAHRCVRSAAVRQNMEEEEEEGVCVNGTRPERSRRRRTGQNEIPYASVQASSRTGVKVSHPSLTDTILTLLEGFTIQTLGPGNQTINPLVSGEPSLPPEPLLDWFFSSCIALSSLGHRTIPPVTRVYFEEATSGRCLRAAAPLDASSAALSVGEAAGAALP
ncbi:unnamed protein product [Pleuronectes platessa]|uniref:Uncharacterized protein n=1 Tax=Pleuronectes platessa TaxID=8262 RepID=A0A9N7U2Y3_PLEPL|nr:unnamed protein product [Pleuronectes platessa]